MWFQWWTAPVFSTFCCFFAVQIEQYITCALKLRLFMANMEVCTEIWFECSSSRKPSSKFYRLKLLKSYIDGAKPSMMEEARKWMVERWHTREISEVIMNNWRVLTSCVICIYIALHAHILTWYNIIQSSNAKPNINNHFFLIISDLLESRFCYINMNHMMYDLFFAHTFEHFWWIFYSNTIHMWSWVLYLLIVTQTDFLENQTSEMCRLAFYCYNRYPE